MSLELKNSTMLLWNNNNKIKYRIAVCGDFFPTMGLKGTSFDTWREKADLLKLYFSDIDYSIVNLECPLDCQGLGAFPKLGVGANLFGSKESLQFLKVLGIGLVGTANNHIMDYGSEGVMRTNYVLGAAGIDSLGASANVGNIPNIKITDLEGIRVGFWSAFLNADNHTAERFQVEHATLKRSRQALALMNEGVSCKIALIHAGLEKSNYPDPFELKQLHDFVEYGFDVVCVSHSHRISGFSKITRKETLSAGFCFHGLGSILSGCVYGELEREGIIAVIGLDENGKVADLSIRPVWLDGLGWGMIPDERKKAMILHRFESVSSDIRDGSFKEKFHKDINKNLLRKLFRDIETAFLSRGLSGVSSKLCRIRPKHLNRLLHKIFS